MEKKKREEREESQRRSKRDRRRTETRLQTDLVGRNQRLLQLPQPKLEQARRYIGIIHSTELVLSSIDPILEHRDSISVSRNSEDSFRRSSSESEDSVGEEGKDDGDSIVGVEFGLDLKGLGESGTEDGGIEGGSLDVKKTRKGQREFDERKSRDEGDEP